MRRFMVVVALLAGGFVSGLASSQESARPPQASPAGRPDASSDSAAASAHGKEVFDHWCWPCHGDGPGKPGTAALQALYHGQKPALLERRTDLTPDLVRYYVRHGVTIMPFFRKTEIGDADLDALAAYLAH